MHKLGTLLAAGLLLLSAAAHADWIERSNAITMEVLRFNAGFEPENISDLGLSEFDAQVSDLGENLHQRRIDGLKEQIRRLEALQSGEKDARVSQDISILITALQDNITSEQLNHELMLPYYNLHEGLFRNFNALLDPRNDASRYPAALERLRRYTGREQGYTPLTEQARARTQERFGVKGLLGPYAGQLESDLGKTRQYVAGMRELFVAAGLEGWEADFAVLETQLAEYRAWLEQAMVPRARAGNQLPPDIYADNLKNYGVYAEPEALIASAQYSYQLLRSEMKALAAQIAKQRGWEKDDLLSVIAALKKQQLPEDKVLATYQQRLAEIEAIIRREDIVTLPERDASIRMATPAEAAAIPASFMTPPQLINNTGQYGEFVLVQSNPALGDEAKMDDWGHDAITWALTVHEARPGHELQFARLVEDGTSLARAIYAMNSANAEGWGLYAESIMHEYLPLEGQLFSLYTRIMRAARMFLDPMVNTGQLSRDGARDFLMEQLLLSRPMASSEADRYAFWAPGQATSYYYGYMALMRLRTEVELALGEAFDQRAFHDFILRQGLLPPDLLREAVLDEFVR
ncbi:DUF885 domain-containing protein [Pseudohalioglobus sediminis]|uniref:DUF885 domain-containing protein n=1 Tax=Pseudohalioglobus sediminis TaxID=2606449 RepID=A0A5B0WST1_9GAMM|nr:DUF885 domain-containing protein [Pseudohalioglobus sediminis]KAA1189548.1 DUF885 domain-containing protein [Pseudohalioglobus sediminis]